MENTGDWGNEPNNMHDAHIQGQEHQNQPEWQPNQTTINSIQGNTEATNNYQNEEINSKPSWQERIFQANDPKEVLEAFIEVSKQSEHVKRSKLQAIVGERLVQLGDIDRAVQFLTLSEATKNLEIQTKNQQNYEDSVNDFGRYSRKIVSGIEDAVSGAGKLGVRMNESAQTISSASLRIAEASMRLGRSR